MRTPRRQTLRFVFVLAPLLVSAAATAAITNFACTSFEAAASPIADDDASARDGSTGTDGADASSSADGGGGSPSIFAIAGQEPIVDIAVNDTHVLWMTSTTPQSGTGHVYTCPKQSPFCTTPTSIPNLNAQTGSMTAKGGLTFASLLFNPDDRGIYSIDSKANANKVLPIGAVLDGIDLQIGDSGFLYYRTRQEPPPANGGSYSGAVMVWDGATKSEVGKYEGDNRFNFQWMTVTQTHLVFTHTLRMGFCARSNCPNVTLSNADPREPRGVATEGVNIFWSSDTDGVVYTCNPLVSADCSVKTVKLSAELLLHEPPRVVLVSGQSLFTTTEKGSIFACDLPSCSIKVQKLAEDWRPASLSYLTSGRTLAVDATDVYYVAESSGTFQIMRVSRNGGF